MGSATPFPDIINMISYHLQCRVLLVVIREFGYKDHLSENQLILHLEECQQAYTTPLFFPGPSPIISRILSGTFLG